MTLVPRFKVRAENLVLSRVLCGSPRGPRPDIPATTRSTTGSAASCTACRSRDRVVPATRRRAGGATPGAATGRGAPRCPKHPGSRVAPPARRARPPPRPRGRIRPGASTGRSRSPPEPARQRTAHSQRGRRARAGWAARPVLARPPGHRRAPGAQAPPPRSPLPMRPGRPQPTGRACRAANPGTARRRARHETRGWRLPARPVLHRAWLALTRSHAAHPSASHARHAPQPGAVGQLVTGATLVVDQRRARGCSDAGMVVHRIPRPVASPDGGC
jgi:hypothetical protein